LQGLDALAIKSLQHTATHCNTLQHTASHCNSLIKSQMFTLTYNQSIIHQACACSRSENKKIVNLHVDMQIRASTHTILIVFDVGVY